MKSFLSYLGGKSRLVSTIVPLIPRHTTYAEAFAGAAWILFGKEPSKNEVINDANRDLTNLYRCVQNHPEELARCIRAEPVSREVYNRLRDTDPAMLTDIQRAARFFYLLKLGFGGRTDRFNYSCSVGRRPSLNVDTLDEVFARVQSRLSRVWIDSMDFFDFIKCYDRAETFFYLDPPYVGYERDYGASFSRERFADLRDLLSGIAGKFLLSINDTPEVREMWANFNVSPVLTMWQAGGDHAKEGAELLIRNY